jgi:colicin import membrane protein
MARKLKTYQTSQGFFDMAIAAPSMKAALDAWGMKSNLFHQGLAWESDDPRIIDATMKAPGVTLRRPVGSHGRFVEHAKLPKTLPATASEDRHVPRKRTKQPVRKVDGKLAKKAAAAFEKQQRHRELKRQKDEALKDKARVRRQRALDLIQAKVDKAEREHDMRIAAIQKEQAVLARRLEVEEARWDKVKSGLESGRNRGS